MLHTPARFLYRLTYRPDWPAALAQAPRLAPCPPVRQTGPQTAPDGSGTTIPGWLDSRPVRVPIRPGKRPKTARIRKVCKTAQSGVDGG